MSIEVKGDLYQSKRPQRKSSPKIRRMRKTLRKVEDLMDVARALEFKVDEMVNENNTPQVVKLTKSVRSTFSAAEEFVKVDLLGMNKVLHMSPPSPRLTPRGINKVDVIRCSYVYI